MPVGAYAHAMGNELKLTVFIGSPDGNEVFLDTLTGPGEDPHGLAERAHQSLLDKGAGNLLAAARTN